MSQFTGYSHTVKNLGHGCIEWRPTAEYLAWLDLEHPKKNADEQAAEGVITPGGSLWKKLKKQEAARGW